MHSLPKPSLDMSTVFDKTFDLEKTYNAYSFPRDPDLHFFVKCSSFETNRFAIEQISSRAIFKSYFCTSTRFSPYLYLDAPSLSKPICNPCLNNLVRNILPEPHLESLLHIVNSFLELPNNEELFQQNKDRYLINKDFEHISFILGLYESSRYKIATYEYALEASKSTASIFTSALRKTIRQEKIFYDKLQRYLLKNQDKFETEELTYYLQTQILDSTHPLTSDEFILLFGNHSHPQSLLDTLYQTWLDSLLLTPLERKAKFFAYVDSLHQLHGLGRAAWLAQRDQLLLRKLNTLEKALAHIKAEPPLLFFIHEQIMNLSYYSRPLTSLNLFYPNYISSGGEKTAYLLPAHYLGWLKYTRNLYKHTADSKTRFFLDYLPATYNQDEISSLLELWEPETGNILSDLKKVTVVLNAL